MRHITAALLVAALSLTSLAGCTTQSRARTFGGTETKTLQPGVKLVNVTWKDDTICGC